MARSVLVLFVLLLLAAPLAACGDKAPPRKTPPAKTGPVPTVREPVVLWGGAIHGLRVGLEPSKKKFAQGEDLIFTVKAQNVLEKPIKVPGFADGAWSYKISFQEETGANFASRGPAIDKSPANDLVLKPGEVWSRTVNVSQDAQIVQERGGSVDSLPRGVYEVMGSYYNMKGEGYWVGGRCFSNIVTITIK